jgi:hypothetical protein
VTHPGPNDRIRHWPAADPDESNGDGALAGGERPADGQALAPFFDERAPKRAARACSHRTTSESARSASDTRFWLAQQARRRRRSPDSLVILLRSRAPS